MTIYLSSKKRGLYTDSELSTEAIQAVTITQRTMLRVAGQCYDLSGRSICPVLMAARLIYGSISKLKLGWDGECLDKTTASNSKKFLNELLQVCKTLEPVPRVWVPMGNEFEEVNCPVDGGEQGFSAHGYVRSENANHGSYCSRLGVARCKV